MPFSDLQSPAPSTPSGPYPNTDNAPSEVLCTSALSAWFKITFCVLGFPFSLLQLSLLQENLQGHGQNIGDSKSPYAETSVGSKGHAVEQWKSSQFVRNFTRLEGLYLGLPLS